MYLCVYPKSVSGCPLRASLKILHSHLPVGECGVPHALPCVPTPWPMLFDMLNVNRCCAVTGSGPTSEGLMEKKLFVSVTENREEVTVQQETAKNLSHASMCAGGAGD